MKFIFVVKVKNNSSDQDYIDAWKKGSSIIQSSQGAQGTVLYRKIGDSRTMLAIATWSSKEARDAAMKKFENAGSEIQAILEKHKQFGNTDIIGNFDEIQRVEPSTIGRTEGDVG